MNRWQQARFTHVGMSTVGQKQEVVLVIVREQRAGEVGVRAPLPSVVELQYFA